MVDGPGAGVEIAGEVPEITAMASKESKKPGKKAAPRKIGARRRPLSTEPAVASTAEEIKPVAEKEETSESARDAIATEIAGGKVEKVSPAAVADAETLESSATTEMKLFSRDAIDNKAKTLEAIINVKRTHNEDVSKEMALLGSLKTLSVATGEAGIFFKQEALVKLKELNHDLLNPGLEAAIEKLAPEAAIGKQKLEVFLEQTSLTDGERLDIANGNLEKLISSKAFEKVEGLDVLVFGKKINYEEAIKMMSGYLREDQIRNLPKDVAIGIGGLILLMFLGVLQAAASANSGNR